MLPPTLGLSNQCDGCGANLPLFASEVYRYEETVVEIFVCDYCATPARVIIPIGIHREYSLDSPGGRVGYLALQIDNVYGFGEFRNALGGVQAAFRDAPVGFNEVSVVPFPRVPPPPPDFGPFGVSGGMPDDED